MGIKLDSIACPGCLVVSDIEEKDIQIPADLTIRDGMRIEWKCPECGSEYTIGIDLY